MLNSNDALATGQCAFGWVLRCLNCAHRQSVVRGLKKAWRQAWGILPCEKHGHCPGLSGESRGTSAVNKPSVNPFLLQYAVSASSSTWLLVIVLSIYWQLSSWVSRQKSLMRLIWAFCYTIKPYELHCICCLCVFCLWPVGSVMWSVAFLSICVCLV